MKQVFLTAIAITIIYSSLAEGNQTRVNDITNVDLNINENLQRHRTTKYRQLVLRRGEPFKVSVHLERILNPAVDRLRLELGIGPEPLLEKGTLFYFPIEPKLDKREIDKFQLKATTTGITNGNKIHLEINLPPTMAVGIYKFKISAKLANTTTIRTHVVRDQLYIIFNPWCKEDDVYMERQDAKDEYVLNEVGKLYKGTYQSVSGQRWDYGQFGEAVLPSIMKLMDRTRLDIKGRADVVKVSRAVSAMVNSHDDNGLLVGNWNRTTLDGVSPLSWSSSAPIFDRYLRSGGRPVKYAQCWVFGAVLTSALRALGIPSRSISNFRSAHDRDSSLTQDEYFIGGVESKELKDTIWNFHVWTDAWMKRRDLPEGYGGWQALDSTPQERSSGLYQLGPASLRAVKEGKVGYAYDVGFVYSEVNADTIQWVLDRGVWRKTSVKTDAVGLKILTKTIGYLDPYGVRDAESIFNQYKFPEGTKQERESFRLASASAGLLPFHYDSYV